jgi:hypothetical protein
MHIAEVLLLAAHATPPGAAVAFARAGLPIFPCEPDGKRPMTRAGFHDASCDIDRVADWWRRTPRANIGMPTGIPSGITVVDVDVKVAATGFAAFERASERGLLDGEIARVSTPSGGMHVYFPVTPTAPQPCWQSAVAHIDFRGDGGYVVVPPSAITDGIYRPFSISSAPPTPVDANALRDFIDPRPARGPQPSHPASAPRGDVLAQWVSRLRDGERNHGLFWAACRLTEAGVSADAVIEVLAPAAERNGLSPAEVQRTVHSAYRHTHAGNASHPGTTSRFVRNSGMAASDAWCLP